MAYRDHFYYVHLEMKYVDGQDKPPHVIQRTGSFPIKEVLRTIINNDGSMLIILKDGHEEAENVRVRNAKGKEEFKRERNWIHSEIYLLPKDAVRFVSFTAIDDFVWVAPPSQIVTKEPAPVAEIEDALTALPELTTKEEDLAKDGGNASIPEEILEPVTAEEEQATGNN